MYKIVMCLALLIFLPNKMYAEELIYKGESYAYVIDDANIIDDKTELELLELLSKVKMLTQGDIRLVTYNANDSKSSLHQRVLDSKGMWDVKIVYDAYSKEVDIITGEKVKEIITKDMVNEFFKREEYIGLTSSAPNESLVYVCKVLADEMLVKNGYESILETEKFNEKNKNGDKVFLLFLFGIALVLLFLTPISPYQKRKKDASNIYVPPNPNGGGFYGSGHTLGGDFTNKDKQSKD